MEDLELLNILVVKRQVKSESGTLILIPGCLIELVVWTWVSLLEPESLSH